MQQYGEASERLDSRRLRRAFARERLLLNRTGRHRQFDAAIFRAGLHLDVPIEPAHPRLIVEQRERSVIASHPE